MLLGFVSMAEFGATPCSNRGSRGLLAIGLVFVVLAEAGCAVQPWERGRLASPDMELAPRDPLKLGEGHARGYREGAAGGGELQGGGCGCG